MPRTIVPEEQQRVSDLSALRNNIRPTPNRTVHVDSDADGAGNIFRWDPTGTASNADGVTTVDTDWFENLPRTDERDRGQTELSRFE